MSFADAFELLRDSIFCVALAAGLCAVLGVYVLLQRVIFVSVAITQASGLGIVLAFFAGSFLAHSDDGSAAAAPAWMNPQLWGIIGAVVCALVFSRRPGGAALASETIVGIVWVLASSVLLLILSSPRVVQEVHEVDSLLYGTAVFVTPGHLKALIAVTVAIVVIHAAFYKQFVFVSFDREMAEALGYRTALWDALMYATLGFGISFAVRTVGALPTFAFLVVPTTAAKLWVDRVGVMFPLAVIFGVVSSLAGYWVSFQHELPTGPTISAMTALLLIPGIGFRVIRGMRGARTSA